MASFLPQQLRQQEAAAAEAEEKEEMEIGEGKAGSERGIMAGKGGTRTPLGICSSSPGKPGTPSVLCFPKKGRFLRLFFPAY